ncbi:MAG: tripartite tricarboxylate transporter TctB family protein [Eubacteriales bacterium]|nr:tripartite tricarboxylate transporter TctB family protein [Eubacteriales bacterium]
MQPVQLLVCLGGAIAYVVLMYFFGFYISTVIFMAAILLYLKVPYLHSAIAIVAILALVYFAFGKFLGVRLPVGTVIKALR